MVEYSPRHRAEGRREIETNLKEAKEDVTRVDRETPGAERALDEAQKIALQAEKVLAVVNGADTAPLTFCPSLFEAVQAAIPPNASFFKNLPSTSNKQLGIYGIAMEEYNYPRPLNSQGAALFSLGSPNTRRR